jgi:hypothetical protein
VARFIGVFNLMVKVIQSREQALSDLVILDESTGAYNLSHFQHTADQELKKGQRYKHPTSVLLVGVSGVEGLEKADQEKILIASADLTSGFPFPLFLHIASTGWGPEETPKIEDVLRQVQASLDQG